MIAVARLLPAETVPLEYVHEFSANPWRGSQGHMLRTIDGLTFKEIHAAAIRQASNEFLHRCLSPSRRRCRDVAVRLQSPSCPPTSEYHSGTQNRR